LKALPDTAERKVADVDVELITRMLREWNSGGVEALLEVFDPEVEVRPALRAFLASNGLPRARRRAELVCGDERAVG
jgi:hypothetical protein